MTWKVLKRSGQTTNATLTQLGAAVLAVPDNTIVTAEMFLVGRDQAGTHRCVYRRYWTGYRQGGGALTQMQSSTIGSDSETDAGLDGTLGASSNDLVASVQGLASTTINWVAIVRYTTVT